MPTGIGYVDETWSPITGCTPISEGCQKCYAAIMHRRLHAMGTPGYERPFEEVRVNWAAADKPDHWRKPRRILTCSMSDWCHEEVPKDGLLLVDRGLWANPQHAFLLLTKRPGCVPDVSRPLNAWLGFTAELQQRLDERMAAAWWLTTAPRVWLSCEPLLGPLDLTAWFAATAGASGRYVVVGPETGPGARECRAAWIEGVCKQCADAAVPHYVKATSWRYGALDWCQDLVPLPAEQPRRGEEGD